MQEEEGFIEREWERQSKLLKETCNSCDDTPDSSSISCSDDFAAFDESLFDVETIILPQGFFHFEILDTGRCAKARLP